MTPEVSKVPSPTPPPARLTFGRMLKSILLPGLVGTAISCAGLFVPPAGWLTNDVTTGKHTGYPDLQPRNYNATVSNTTLFVADAASRKLGWKVTRTEPDKGSVVVRVPSGPFTDDLSVTVTAEGEGSRVVVRSHSRVGFGDLGANARHIRALQAAMDDKLPRLAQ